MEDEMKEERDNAGCRPTLWYAVVHFDENEKGCSPCFLRRIPYTNSDGMPETSYRHFTYNMNKAALFNSVYDAEMAKKDVDARMAGIGHPLAGHIKVLKLFGLVQELTTGASSHGSE